MRSRRKQGMSGTRYRAHTGGTLKGRMIVRANRVRSALRRATAIRIQMEKERLQRRNASGRMEEPLALALLHGVPSVHQIATSLLSGDAHV
jgi:hypothetical protein